MAPPCTPFMTIPALSVLYLTSTRRVRCAPLVVFDAYLIFGIPYSAWCYAEMEQIRARLDASLVRCGICEECRARAFACAGCLVRMVRAGYEGRIDGE